MMVLFILASLFFILRVANANLYLRGLIRHGVPLHEIPTSINDLMTGDNQHRRLYQKIVQGIGEGSVQMAEVAHDNGAISLLEMFMIIVAVVSCVICVWWCNRTNDEQPTDTNVTGGTTTPA
jgi:preprotein translocase subunit SecG